MLPKLSDTKEIIGYGHWLIMRGQHAGNFVFNGHTPTVEERDISCLLQIHLADYGNEYVPLGQALLSVRQQ